MKASEIAQVVFWLVLACCVIGVAFPDGTKGLVGAVLGWSWRVHLTRQHLRVFQGNLRRIRRVLEDIGPEPDEDKKLDPDPRRDPILDAVYDCEHEHRNLADYVDRAFVRGVSNRFPRTPQAVFSGAIPYETRRTAAIGFIIDQHDWLGERMTSLTRSDLRDAFRPQEDHPASYRRR